MHYGESALHLTGYFFEVPLAYAAGILTNHIPLAVETHALRLRFHESNRDF